MDYKDKIKEILKDKTIPEEQRKKLEEILLTAEISEDERIRKKLIEAVKGDMVVGGTKDKQLAIAWLEKQGEKPASQAEFNVGDSIKEKNCTTIYKILEIYKDGSLFVEDNLTIPYSELDKWELVKKEPKFKVGDWCIDNEDGTIFQIVKVLNNTYTYETNEGKEYSCTHYSLENDARLWTIADAKCGDVLSTE